MKQQHNHLQSGLLLLTCLFSIQSYAYDGEIRSPDNIPGSTKVNAEQLIEIASTQEKLLIVDSRITDDRHQGYIEDSISLSDENTDCDSLATHLETKQTPVAFYCNGPKCGRSAKAVKTALACGYKKIFWFRGGFEEWKAKNYPLIKN